MITVTRGDAAVTNCPAMRRLYYVGAGLTTPPTSHLTSTVRRFSRWEKIWLCGWLAADHSSAPIGAILALVLPTHKRHFAPGRLPLLASSTYRRARLFESDQLRLNSILSMGRRTAVCASPRSK